MNLPDYTLRYSKRAKYLQLRLSYRGLEVIVPIKKKLKDGIVTQFIEKKRPWIEKNWDRICKTQIDPHTTPLLPTSIFLNAINQMWHIVYLETSQDKISLFANQNKQITLMGDITNEQSCLKKLRAWLKKMAHPYLYQQLMMLAGQTNLTFKEMTIRHNTTRWGSCSSQGNINLCCKLLFLPPHLMDHVLLHELCHTKIMRHGKDFWELLTRFDCLAKTHAKQLKTVQIPLWVR